MADMKGIIKKAGGLFKPRTGEPRKGISPEETELNFFKEQQRKEHVKKELKVFRDKENKKVLLGDDQLFKSPHQVIGHKNIFKQKNTFNKQNKKIPSLIQFHDKPSKTKNNVRGSANAFFKG